MSGDAATVRIRSATVTFWRSGPADGDVLLMVHGMASDHAGLDALAAGLRNVALVTFDLPGSGQSESLPGPHTLDSYAEVVEGLRQHLGLQRFALVGHSLGASIALAYAERYGAGLSALCVLNPVVDAGSATARIGRRYYEMSSRLPGALGRLLLTSRPMVYVSDQALFTTRDRALRRRILRQDYATARMTDPRAIRESYVSLSTTPLLELAPHITTPTLLITGSRDPLSTPEAARRLGDQLPHAHVEIVPNAGHLLPAEQPALVASLINRFLVGGRVAEPPSGPVAPPDAQ